LSINKSSLDFDRVTRSQQKPSEKAPKQTPLTSKLKQKPLKLGKKAPNTVRKMVGVDDDISFTTD